MIVKEIILIIKNAVSYCKYNKKYLFLVIFLMALIHTILAWISQSLNPILSILVLFTILIIMCGYGLCITKDIINSGKHLPRFDLKEVLILGSQGIVISIVYIFIQFILTYAVSSYLHFEIFELENMLLNLTQTIHELLAHNIISGIIFILSGLIITYVTMFFMEISLAMIADGESLANVLDIKAIKGKIDMIGWKEYSLEYTTVIFAITILTFISEHFEGFGVNIILMLLMFSIEFGGIGKIYRKTKS